MCTCRRTQCLWSWMYMYLWWKRWDKRRKKKEKNFFHWRGGRGRKEIKTCRRTNFVSYYIINIIFSNFIVELKQFISLIRTHHTHTVGKQVLCYVYISYMCTCFGKQYYQGPPIQESISPWYYNHSVHLSSCTYVHRSSIYYVYTLHIDTIVHAPPQYVPVV